MLLRAKKELNLLWFRFIDTSETRVTKYIYEKRKTLLMIDPLTSVQNGQRGIYEWANERAPQIILFCNYTRWHFFKISSPIFLLFGLTQTSIFSIISKVIITDFYEFNYTWQCNLQSVELRLIFQIPNNTKSALSNQLHFSVINNTPGLNFVREFEYNVNKTLFHSTMTYGSWLK